MANWSELSFKATHNSWQGNNKEKVGDILTQLDEGVRFIELDIEDDNYSSVHDYQITQNDGSGKDVWLQGRNPRTRNFKDWIQQIAGWSLENKTHAPIVILVDFKGALSGKSFAAGNLAALNQELLTVFGDQLLLAETFEAALPDEAKVRGKIVTLFTDNSRLPYLRDGGQRPAVAINSAGQVVEVHDNGNGTLWYWTGQLLPSGRVQWARHGQYDTGEDAAVALNDHGVIVEVHKSQNNDGLWYHVGILGPDLEITWSPSHKYDNGAAPAVRFNAATGDPEEEHRESNNAQLWSTTGKLDTTTRTIAWQPHQKVTIPQAPWDKSTAASGERRIHVASESNYGSPSSTLYYYLTPGGGPFPIRYRQVAFVDIESGDPYWMSLGQWFCSMGQQDNPDYTFLEYRRADGWLTRVLNFDTSKLPWQAPTFPATNSYDAAYVAYCQKINTIA